MKRSSQSFSQVNIGSDGMKYTNVKQGPSIASVLTDGGFNNWGTNDIPNNWYATNMTDGSTTDYSLFAQSTNTQAGTYALALSTTAAGLSPVLMNNLNTYGADGETMQVRLYAKTDDSSAVGVIYMYYEDGTDDQYLYNFTGVNAGTWTLMVGGPTSDQYEVWNPTDSYTQHSFTQVTLPGTNVNEGEAWIFNGGGNSKTVLLDEVEILVAGVDQAQDGDMESWTAWADQSTPLNSWTFESGNDWAFTPALGDLEASAILNSASAQAGSYSVQMMVGNASNLTDNNDRGYVYQQIAGDAASPVTASVYTKSTNSKVPYMVLLDDNPGSHTQIWDFVANTWDTLGTTVTDLPGTSNALACSATTSYVKNSEDLTIPASGKITMVLMSDKGDGADQQSYYFDTALLGEEVAGEQIQQFSVKCDSDMDDFEDGDRILEWAFGSQTEGVYDTALTLGLSDEGESELDVMWNSDLPGRQNFSGMDLVIAGPTSDYNPATKSYVSEASVQLLGSTANINMLNTGQTSLGTVPSGYSFIATTYLIEVVSSDTPSSTGAINIGTASGGYSDVCSSVIGGASDTYSGTVASTAKISEGEEIFVDVTTADTGTELTIKVHLTGILIAN